MVALVLSMAFATVLDGARTLTDRQGRSIEAEILTIDETRVQIKRASDGRTFWVPFDMLSPTDVAALKEERAAQALPSTSAPATGEEGPSGAISINNIPLTHQPKAFDSVPRSQIEEWAEIIDNYIERAQRTNGVQPNTFTDNPTFLRRTYLAIAGRIPSFEETEAFLEDRSPNKRKQLIDSLLQSEGYVSHSFNFWADILRLRSDGGFNSGGYYAQWVKQAIRDNIPYDRFVAELLTAEGYPWDNGAVGYYMRDDGMPLDNMSNTAQIFLGTQMVCAQCHDHPFDKWTQYQYYQLAAFTYGVETRVGVPRQREVRKILDGVQDKRERDVYRRALSELYRPITYGTKMGGREVKLPHDYQYSDAKPEEVVKPEPIFGPKIEMDSGLKNRVGAYAAWMTSPDNPRFTKVIANRLWKRVMGRGLFEPIDDLTDDTQVSHPELLGFLTNLMKHLDYDLKQFERVLYSTDTFQRQVHDKDLAPSDTYYFPGPVIKRMSAEQLWDSMLTLTIPSPDYRTRGDQHAEKARMQSFTSYLSNRDPAQIEEYVRKMGEIRMAADEELNRINKFIRTAEQRNDEEKVRELRGEADEIRRERDRLEGSIAFTEVGITMDGDGMGGGMMMNRMMNGGSDSEAGDGENEMWRHYSKNLVRASELRSPAPRGHFLRQFGQSDREVIENASTEASVSQILTLLNGPMFKELLKPTSVLSRNIVDASSPKKKVRTIFLSLVGREPTDEEYKIMLRTVRKDENQVANQDWDESKEDKYEAEPITKGHEDIIWALLNTRQFSFIN